uniref:Uncharacterized protein n=1 Tax=Arundo donax TaxID=35708 RepID=A0A0A9HPM8_ARUDO
MMPMLMHSDAKERSDGCYNLLSEVLFSSGGQEGASHTRGVRSKQTIITAHHCISTGKESEIKSPMIIRDLIYHEANKSANRIG